MDKYICIQNSDNGKFKKGVIYYGSFGHSKPYGSNFLVWFKEIGGQKEVYLEYYWCSLDTFNKEFILVSDYRDKIIGELVDG